MLPSFIGIGTQRAGTTWVYNCLKQHPDVFMSTPKELHYFYANYSEGIEWYEQQFKGFSNEAACGEITPDYMHHEEAIKNIKKDVPNAKLFMVLRNPVERAISAYKLHYKHHIGVSFEEACEQNNDLMDRGHYYRYLEMILSHFSLDQLKILIYEDINTNPGGFMDEIYEFIGVDVGVRPDAITRNYNRIIYPKTQKVLQKLKLNWAIESVRETKIGDWVRSYQQRLNEDKNEIDKSAINELKNIYREDTTRLEKLINRDLGIWK